MTDKIEFLELMERAEHERSARRNFIRMCGGAAAMTGGLALLAACDGDDSEFTPVPVPTPSGTPAGTPETDVLNFALQLEYLEASYFAYATTGSGLAAGLQTGLGTQGAVATGSGAGAARAVAFTDPVVRQYAREIAADEVGHVTFLRTALGNLAQAQPALNLSGSASVTINNVATVGAFTTAARAAQIVGANEIFDPYLNDENFLIGSYLLTAVGVSAYRGSARLITNRTFLEAAAGILATECYHDATIRTELWRRGLTVPSIYTRVTAISNARDTLDGSTDTDQDIGNATTSNLVPTDAGGLVLGRTPQQVLRVVYLNGGGNIASGGFYPAGMNGAFRNTN